MLDKNKRPIDLKISKSFIFSSNYQIKLYKLNSKFIITKITWLRPTLPGSFPPSTISARELNFCVRNGNRCILSAIVTT